MDTGVKTELCETASDQYLDFSDLWLGIQLNHKIDNINGLSFYFNWKEIPGHLKFYQSISLAKWFINDHEINVEAGLLNNNTNQISNDEKIFLFDISRRFETYIKAHYSDRFFRVVDNVNISSESKYPYPNIFKEVFESNDLKNFKEDILWIRIDGSHAISEQSVIEADIGINCFPAFNRRLHSGRPFALEKDFNIIPLKTEDSFFSVKRVFAKHKGEYSQIPFGQIGEQKTETYTLRKGGIGRFEKRNAKEMLEYILELMRDESAAFKAWDDRLLAKEIRILDQNLNRLEQNVAQKSSHGDSYHYLLINSKKSEDVWVEFWSTTGLVGNSITQGNLFKTTSINLKKDSVISMSKSVGGMDALKSDDAIFAYKSALLSRNRLVTKEDIKAACYAEMGSEVKNIEIKQGIMIGDSMKEGLSRSIDILLQAKPDLNRSSDELNQLARQLKVVLESKMAINSKLRIKFIE
jgi:hypothetical protein